jgi:hypothetical protein
VDAFSYNEREYSSPLLSSIENKIKQMVESASGDLTGTSYLGFSTAEERALFDRAMDREVHNYLDTIDSSREEAAQFGHIQPPGFVEMVRHNAQMKAQEGISSAGRDIAIKRADLFRQQWMDTFKTAIELMVQNRNYFVGRYERLLQARRFLIEAQVQILNAMIAKYNSRLTAWKTEVDVYVAKLEALKTIEVVYHEQVEAMRALLSANETRIRAVIAELEAEKSKVDIYRAQIEAEATKLRADTDIFGAKIKGYDSYQSATAARINSLAHLADGLGQIATAGAQINSQETISQNADLLRKMEISLQKAGAKAKLFEDSIDIKAKGLGELMQSALASLNYINSSSATISA